MPRSASLAWEQPRPRRSAPGLPPGRLRERDRRRGARRLPRADAPGRDHSRARARARSCPGPRARRRARARLPVGSWRQGSCGGARPLSMKTLVVYLMSGPKTPELAAAAVAGGADVIELGFPFSDPLADGPVIRRAAERALGQA